MNRRLIGIVSSIALMLPLLSVQAQAQFVVETQAQTTVDAVLQEFPSPTPEDLLTIRNRSSSAPLDPSDGYFLTDPTMGTGINVVRSSAPAQLAVLSIPLWDSELGDRLPRDTFVFQVPLGTVISNDPDAGVWGPDFLSRLSEEGETLYSNSYFDQDNESMAVELSMPITIETTDIYTFGFVDSVYGYVYVQGVEETGDGPSEPGSESGIPFTDVSADAWYAAPVAWAVEQGIPAGTTPTTFGPDDTCTTAQILTFLWRACGSPAPAASAPFDDVAADSWYAAPAAWAYEEGLVSGGTFNGESPCTRASTVTYLWKLAGSPESGEAAFDDVAADASYAQAVSWAVQEGITAGTGDTTFGPDDTCTRSQIMTFLYRDFSE